MLAASSASAASAASAAATATSALADSEHRRRERRVLCIRVAVIATLLVSASTVAAFIGWYVAVDERSDFELQYRDSVSKVAEFFQHRVDTKHETAKTFSAMITSRYGNKARRAEGRDPLWPNVTMPDFEAQAEGILHIADGRALSFNPVITQDVDRLVWEAHAAESAGILGDERLRTPDPDASWPDNRTVSFGIYSRDKNRQVVYDPGHSPESKYPAVMVPVWQIAPIKTNEKAVMFNLHSEANRRRALDHMIEHKVPALTAILQLVQDGKDTRPSSILFFPVFDTFPNSNEEDGEEDEEGTPTERRSVVGSVSIVFSWDTLLNKILPDYIKGMVCVLQSSTGQTFSYSISGDDVTLLGEGDRHDASYDQYGQHVEARHKGEEEFITYQLHMYPSREFEAQYVTNRAAVYSAGAVLIFLFTSGLFLLYDYLVEDRQKRTARMARQTGNIVESLFPAAFRERLYNIHNSSGGGGGGNDRISIGGETARSDGRRSSIDTADGSDGLCTAGTAGTGSRASVASGSGSAEGAKASGSVGGSEARRGSSLSFSKSQGVRKSKSTMGNAIRSGLKMAMKQIDSPMTSAQSHPPGGCFDDEPIAELFMGTSIMFSDIVGFTKWSSEHSPNQVFRLLEQIFWEFDDVAARLRVFKLGTIGDCYIAVTGIPDPVDDHATLLARFTAEARDRVHEVCARLDLEEGMDTGRLNMRFGIHSGATTAGILRGTKSRFELFGDTINTASRMESTGVAGMIQVSEETADLIRKDGRGGWLRAREGGVEAKGKGRLQTYWLEPSEGEGRRRVSFSEKVNNFFAEDGLQDSDPFYKHEYNSSGGLLSQWEEEEKVEEDDLEGGVVELSCAGASKHDDAEGHVVAMNLEEDDLEGGAVRLNGASDGDNSEGHAAALNLDENNLEGGAVVLTAPPKITPRAM